MNYFVPQNSIVRRIWGKADTVLFIFAGAAAEFAVNKAVDWLYFTGKLPADPLGRLFSTMTYSRRIIFSEQEGALRAIDQIIGIHRGVEQSRGAKIPDWAYRDVLFMLIDYSIRSFELLERPLTQPEKEEVFDVFYRMGQRMQLTGLPLNYSEWANMRGQHMHENLAYGQYTGHLYLQYRKHLGLLRFTIMKQVQKILVPPVVNNLLRLGKPTWIKTVLFVYVKCRALRPARMVKDALLPAKYKTEIQQLDIATA